MFKLLLFFGTLVLAKTQNKAVVYLTEPHGTNQVSGNVSFLAADGGVYIAGRIVGLSPGSHGFHVHEFGNIAAGCGATGSHFNPHHMNHGGPNSKQRHVGDLGNIVAGSDGIAVINFFDKVIALTGINNIIGRGLVVHSGVDDLGLGGNAESLKTGNAGARLACGVVGINS